MLLLQIQSCKKTHTQHTACYLDICPFCRKTVLRSRLDSSPLRRRPAIGHGNHRPPGDNVTTTHTYWNLSHESFSTTCRSLATIASDKILINSAFEVEDLPTCSAEIRTLRFALAEPDMQFFAGDSHHRCNYVAVPVLCCVSISKDKATQQTISHTGPTKKIT